MQNLTCGERAIRCLLGQPIDRVPYGVGIGWLPWGETMERWRVESGKPDLDLAQEFGFDGSFTGPVMRSGIFPEYEYAVLEETDEFIISRDGRGITMRNRRDYGSMPEFLAYPVTTPADWERLKAERLCPETPGRIGEDWPAFRARMAQSGEAVQVGWFPFGIFGTPRDLLGAEELLVAFYTEPEMVRDMMEHLTTLWISLWQQVASEVRIDHIHIWEDMSGRQGSLISPAMVRDFMMPSYDRIVAFAASAGVRLVSVDTDGDCRELVPVMMEHGINAFLPFEVQAGNDILAYRRQYPTLGIIGGLDKRALAGNKDDIEREIAKAGQMLEQGRYIPGFDHLIPPDVPWENYRYAAERMKEVCFSTASA